MQTLNVTSNLCLCDCPGLVLPQYANSKAEMVAAGKAERLLWHGYPCCAGLARPITVWSFHLCHLSCPAVAAELAVALTDMLRNMLHCCLEEHACRLVCRPLIPAAHAPPAPRVPDAGVIPIDRLTDVRAPVEAVAHRVGRRQLERVYGMHLPAPGRQEDPNRQAHGRSAAWSRS